MTAALTYFDRTLELLDRIRRTQVTAIERAAGICVDSIAAGGIVFLFGAGHSRMMCEEMTPRQGALVGFCALVELALSNHTAIVGANGLRSALHLEKYEGYAEEILKSFSSIPDGGLRVPRKTSPSDPGSRPRVETRVMSWRQRSFPDGRS